MSSLKLQYNLTVEGVELNATVVGFAGREALSQGSRFVVTAVVEQWADAADLLGKPASVELERIDSSRWFHGIVVDAAIDAPRFEDELFRLRIHIASRVELLRLGRNSRIYQEKSIPDIVKDVLDQAGIPADLTGWELAGSYDPRPYVVQYNESDFAFITRLLADEGIAFAIRSSDAAEVLTFFDDPGFFVPIDGNPTLRERDATNLSVDVVWDLRDTRTVASDAVCLRDYDFTKPSVDLTVRDQCPPQTGREVYSHPGGYAELSAGKARAKRLLERLRVPARMLRGSTDTPFVEPGKRITVSDHPRGDVNGDHQIVEVRHSGFSAPGRDERTVQYECHISVIPAGVPYRPDAEAAPPIVGGVHLGWNTTPAGGEIHVDAHGRVKVRFPWDRSGITDDKSSTWMRVGQLALGGSMIHPRLDFEVIVDFEMGSIDRPMVCGHLYNAEKPPPYALPADKTKSSLQTATTGGGPGANEWRTEDSGGGEEMFLNASKDLTTSIEHDAEWGVNVDTKYSVGSNNTLNVGSNYRASVDGARSLTVSGNQSVNVEAAFSEGVNASLTWNVDGARMVKAGGDHSEDVKGTLDRTVGSLQCITGLAGYGRKIVGASTTNVKAAWVEVAGSSRAVSAASINETVSALKFIKAKQYSVACGAAYAMTAAAESVKCGGSRNDSAKGAVAIQAGGGVSIKAKNITFSAANKLVFKGGACTIELTKAGAVTIKAPTIILKGVDALNQAMHKSN